LWKAPLLVNRTSGILPFAIDILQTPIVACRRKKGNEREIAFGPGFQEDRNLKLTFPQIA
jgi:hypothetical protein